MDSPTGRLRSLASTSSWYTISATSSYSTLNILNFMITITTHQKTTATLAMIKSHFKLLKQKID
jgi:hypothetical protein